MLLFYLLTRIIKYSTLIYVVYQIVLIILYLWIDILNLFMNYDFYFDNLTTYFSSWYFIIKLILNILFK